MPEITEPAFSFRDDTLVSYGLPFAQLLKLHLDRMGAQRVYVFYSATLARNHPEQPEALRQAVGNRLVGEKFGVIQHSTWTEIIEVFYEIAPKNPDTFVVLGGSSACDVAKVVALMDGNPPADGQYTHDYLAELHAGLALAKKAREGMNGARIRTICIPTTLSAAEYTPYAGATDDRTVEKKQFSHRTIAPAAVITDGRLALLTPAAGVWVPSGVRAIDHCVESFVSAETNTVSEGLAVAGLTKLLPALLATATGTEDPAGTDRLQAHLGARDSVHASMQPGVKCPVGASHGIGHIMGPYGVQHGHTSCVLLPNVMRWSQPAIVEKQRELSEAIWECHPSVAAVLEKRGLRRADASLADLLDAIFRELGMPRTLGEVGIGEDKIEEIAAKSMLDPCIPYNARPITRKEDIVEILRTAL